MCLFYAFGISVKCLADALVVCVYVCGVCLCVVCVGGVLHECAGY